LLFNTIFFSRLEAEAVRHKRTLYPNWILQACPIVSKFITKLETPVKGLDLPFLGRSWHQGAAFWREGRAVRAQIGREQARLDPGPSSSIGKQSENSVVKEDPFTTGK
jgi:hypothetical protein